VSFVAITAGKNINALWRRSRQHFQVLAMIDPALKAQFRIIRWRLRAAKARVYLEKFCISGRAGLLLFWLNCALFVLKLPDYFSPRRHRET
jgi:hypothetical protein